MIQSGTLIHIIDNSPVLLVKFLSTFKKFKYSLGSVGVASINLVRSRKIKKNKKKVKIYKKGQLVRVLILTLKNKKKRIGGISFFSSRITGCLILENNTPASSRLRGILFREVPIILNQKKFLSISEFIY